MSINSKFTRYPLCKTQREIKQEEQNDFDLLGYICIFLVVSIPVVGILLEVFR